MNLDTFLHYLGRLVFAGALAAMFLAFLELVAQFAGRSLIAESYAPGRLIELAAALLVLVIAITLREIRDGIRAKD